MRGSASRRGGPRRVLPTEQAGHVLRRNPEQCRGWSESQLARNKSAYGAVDVPVWNEKLKRVSRVRDDDAH